MFLSDLMLRKTLKQIRLILSTYPRRHLYLLATGFALMLCLVFFSSMELDSDSSKESLYNQISIVDLNPDVNKDVFIPELIELKKAEIEPIEFSEDISIPELSHLPDIPLTEEDK